MTEHHHVKLPAKQQQMLDHIQRAKRLGQSLSDYAKQHDVNQKALYNYHWLLRKKGLLETPGNTPFVKATTTTRPDRVKSVTCRVVFPNGIYVDVHDEDIGLPSLLQQVQSL